MSTLKDEITKEDMPRERLLHYGAESLSNDELLAVLLRTGTKGKSVKELARNVLTTYGTVQNLRLITTQKLQDIKGLGAVKAVTLLAALELGRRVFEENPIQKKLQLKNSYDVYKYFGKYIAHEKQENFLVIYLDTQKQYITHKIIFKGTLDSSVVHPREIFKLALLESASSIVLMHNHPSEVLDPSKADDDATATIIEAGEIIGIHVLDHLIVNPHDYYSYIEKGRIHYEEN